MFFWKQQSRVCRENKWKTPTSKGSAGAIQILFESLRVGKYKSPMAIYALTKTSSRLRSSLAGTVICFLYLTKPTVAFSSLFSPTLITDEVAALIYLLPIIKLGFQDSNLPLAEPSVEQQTRQIIDPQLPTAIKPHKFSSPLSFSDHTGLQQAGAEHFNQLIHVYPLTVSDSGDSTPDECTATEASGNIQYRLEGGEQLFSSFRMLLTIPELWWRFTEYLLAYDPYAELPDDEADAKCVVLNDLELRELFLLINNIQQVPQTAARVRSTAAALREVRESTTSRVRNIAMEDSLARHDSIMSISGREYRHQVRLRSRNEFIHAIDLVNEGFYYSHAHQQIECFSCGGVLDPDKISHCSSLRELHGKFYPDCRLLLQQAGDEYVSRCQQNLTDEECEIAPPSLPDDPGLYSEPVSGDDIALDLASDQSEFDQARLELARQMCAKPDRRPDHWPGADYPVPSNSDILPLRTVLCPESFQALHTLQERIETPRHGHNHRCGTLRRNFLEITNILNSLPPELCRLAGTEITALIAVINQDDCQDYTLEVLDQMHTRVIFAILRHELQSSLDTEQPAELFDVFDRLKRFFNEFVLYKLLGDFMMNDTEIRLYLKDRFSGIYRFSRTDIVQAFPSFALLSDELIERVEQTFVKRISNQAGFSRYLTDLFSTDTVFLDYLKQRDEHFAERYNDIVAAAYSDLEQCTPGNPGLSEQAVLEGAVRINAGRTARITRLVEDYVETQVALFWNRILENEHLQNQQNHE